MDSHFYDFLWVTYLDIQDTFYRCDPTSIAHCKQLNPLIFSVKLSSFSMNEQSYIFMAIFFLRKGIK